MKTAGSARDPAQATATRRIRVSADTACSAGSARAAWRRCFARSSPGPEGFERELVLKRILPRLSDTGDFKTMFIREAKISALLLHPNIVQIYDFGQAEGAYFIAMESVQGVTLREALTTLRKGERAVPHMIAADVTRQICLGLDYAHTLHGPDGSALEIVHQDISPTNIMLAFNGTVKILDFGIARRPRSPRKKRRRG